MSKLEKAVETVISIILIGVSIFFVYTPSGRSIWNTYIYSGNKADENQYEVKKEAKEEVKKEVEDTARAMIATYKSDVATYNQYKNSDNEEKQSWAEQAKMRANRTANTYNEYILKNSYIGKDNLPSDIAHFLPIIE